MIECFLTNLYSIDVMAPFCIEMKKRGYECHMALDKLFWKLSYGEHFDIQKAIKKADKWGVKLNLRLNYEADIAVTQWRVDWALFGLYKNLKARMSYGVGLNKKTNFAENDFRFDLYFVNGNLEKDVLIKNGVDIERIIQIGSPKLKYQKINYFIQKTKPIITYLPTWDEFNCIDIAIQKLKLFRDKYDIYIKPHPLQSKEDLKKLSQFNLLSKNITLKSVVEFSDIIVGDLKSGVLCECLYFKDIPIFAFTQTKHLQFYYKSYKQFEDIITENKDINLNIRKDKIKLIDYCFSEDKVYNFKVTKISPTIENITELDILKQRLENTYKHKRGEE